MHHFNSLCILVVAFAAALGTNGLALAQDAVPGGSDDFMLQYARTYLKLTEANLAYDQARNARARGSVSKARLDERQEDVRVAKKLLSAAEQGGRQREFEVFVRLAASGYRSAYSNWQRAKSVHEKASTAFSAQEVQRLRLRAELALINYERGKSLVGADPTEQANWKLNFLYDEVLRLNSRVEELSRLAR